MLGKVQLRTRDYRFGAVFGFIFLHLSALAVFFVPFAPRLLVWLAATYSLRMFAVTAGYHRYFSHRSYQMGATDGPVLGGQSE